MNKIINVLLVSIIFISCKPAVTNNKSYLTNTFEIYTDLIKEKNIERVSIEPVFMDKLPVKIKETDHSLKEKDLENGIQEAKHTDQKEIILFWEKLVKIISQDSINAYDEFTNRITEQKAYFEVSNPIFNLEKQIAVLQYTYQCGRYCSYLAICTYSYESGKWKMKSDIRKSEW